jgi:hypothetical protein
MGSTLFKGFWEKRGTSSWYLVLVIGTNIGFLLPQTRLMAALLLICLLPGYLFSERLRLWKDPFFAAVGSLSLSFFLSPLIILPACLVWGTINVFIIYCSLNIFLLVLTFLPKNEARILYQGEEHHSLVALLIFFVCLWVVLYDDLTGFGPYCEDWIYFSGIINELSRNFPPRNPEASFLHLKQPWGFWLVFAMIHKLGDISVWKLLEIMSVLFSFIFLGWIYKITLETTENHLAGASAILFLSLSRHLGWILKGFSGRGWIPWFDLGYQHLYVATGYSLLWGWYALPALLPLLASLYFFIRYVKENKKLNLFLSLGICSIGPFFHPAYYLAFLTGLSIFIFISVLRKNFRRTFLLFYLTFLPYFLTFYLYFQPSSPDQPIYLFQFSKELLLKRAWSYLAVNGPAIPLAVWAVFKVPSTRIWILPFSLLFATLSILGRGGVNPSHVWLLDHLFISLLAGIGLGSLKPYGKKGVITALTAILLLIVPPYVQEVSTRIQEGWSGSIKPEQVAAGTFIRKTTHPKSSFLIFPDSRYAAETVEGLGERVLIFGFPFHLDRTEKKADVNRWEEEIRTFFLASDPEKIKSFLGKYKVDYLFLGPDEQAWLKKHQVDLEGFRRTYTTVYTNREIVILKIKGRDE